MKRRRYSDSEHSEIQKLRQDNKRLKRDLVQLRKQLDRVDLDQFKNLKDLIDSQDREAHPQHAHQDKDWTCWTCRTGTLRLRVLEKPGGAVYNRMCDNKACRNKTKFQKFHDKVKGPK